VYRDPILVSEVTFIIVTGGSKILFSDAKPVSLYFVFLILDIRAPVNCSVNLIRSVAGLTEKLDGDMYRPDARRQFLCDARTRIPRPRRLDFFFRARLISCEVFTACGLFSGYA